MGTGHIRCPACNRMGSGKLEGYCNPCYRKVLEGRKPNTIESAPMINRKNYMEYGTRHGEKQDTFFPSEYPCLKDKYGLEKERV